MKLTSLLLSILFISLSALGCVHHDPWTKTDTVLAVTSMIASTADAYTTKTGDFDRYINPVMNKDNIVPVTVLIEAGVIGASWFLPTKLRRALLISNITLRSGFVAHNLLQD